MAETFDCPKCGAPLQYTLDNPDHQDSLVCPYCGETVILPAELRHPSPSENIDLGQVLAQVQETLHSNSVDMPEVDRLAHIDIPAARQTVRKWAILGGIGALILGMFAIFAASGLIGALLRQFDDVLPGLAPQVVTLPTATQVPTPTTAKPIQAATALEVLPPTPKAPAKTATPTPDLTVTAQTEVTRQAQRERFSTQQNWPLALQEKFVDDHLNWNVGADDGSLASEDLSIADQKYVWKFTTKKSMGSFTYPDMPVQTDLSVSVDLQVTASSGNAADQYGITFRISEEDQTFYFFGVNPEEDTYSLTYYNGSTFISLIPITQTDQFKPGQVNHLAVSMQGSEILLVINDVLVNSFADARSSSGIAGLGVHLPFPMEEVGLIFTNFNVRAPKK